MASVLRKVSIGSPKPYETFAEANKLEWIHDRTEGAMSMDRDPFVLAGNFRRRAEKAAVALAACVRYASEIANIERGSSVGAALCELIEQGIVLADVHLNNVGLVRRNDTDWTITDPGHAVFLDPKYEDVEIEVL
jgi:hypothetical protein